MKRPAKIILPKGVMLCRKCRASLGMPSGSVSTIVRSWTDEIDRWQSSHGGMSGKCKHSLSLVRSVNGRGDHDIWDQENPEVFAKYEFNVRMDRILVLKERESELSRETCDPRYNMAQFQGLADLLRCIQFVLSAESVVWCPEPSAEHAGEIKRSAGKLATAWDVRPLVGNMRQTEDEVALLIGSRQKPYWVPCKQVFADRSEQAGAFFERLGKSLKRA